MRQAWTWFLMSCKRYLHRAAFVGILLLLPAAACLVRGLEREEGTEIRIAVCVAQEEEPAAAEGTGAGMERSAEKPASDREPVPPSGQPAPLEQLLAEDLVNRGGDSLFRFYRCEDEDAVKAEVAARRAECGYVISAGLRQKLDEKTYKRCIRVYSSPSTVTAKLSTEVVFAALVKRYDRELFLDYVEEGAAFAEPGSGGQKEQLLEMAEDLYEAWSRDGGTFRFVYGEIEKAGSTAAPETAGASTPLFPVRGIVAVSVFIVGLYSGAISLGDEKRGLFLALPTDRRRICRLASMLGPVVLAALSGLAALAASGDFTEVWREGAAMAAYSAAVVLFAWGLGRLCRREAVLCCLIPFFLVGSLVFCPVIADVGRYLPPFRAAGRLFLPWYYLRVF